MNYIVDKEFDYKALTPIAKNIEWKLRNGWDDYNELAHCTALVDKYAANNDVFLNTHTVIKNEKIVGCLLIIGGEADYNSYIVDNENERLEFKKSKVMLNYFHISPEDRGIGENWLKEDIIPYYRDLGVMNIYVKSSHEKAWTLYNRLGKEIGEYECYSDNMVYKRKGKIFRIKIN